MYLRYFLLYFFTLLIAVACSTSQEKSFERSADFTADSTALITHFTNALKSATPQIHLDSAKEVMRNASNKYAAADLYAIQLATFQLRTGDFDNAMSLAEKGIKLSLAFDSSARGKFFNVQGHVHSFKRENTEAIESFKKALAVFENKQDSLNIAYINNNIANIFFSINDYNSAYDHASKSLSILEHFPENQYYPSVMSVLAISEAFIGKIEEAEVHARKAKALTQGTPNIVPYALSLYALGDIATARDSFEVAIGHYTTSLSLCEQFNLTPYVLINKTALLNTLTKGKQFDKALQFGKEALALSEAIKNENIQLSIHKNLAKAYEGLKKHELAMQHMSTAYTLKEEISSKENKSIIHDLLIQYETEKKDKILSENKIKLLEDEAIINRSKFFIALLSLSILGLVGFVYLFMKSRKQEMLRLKQEKETDIMKANLFGEQRERLRLSRELHDGIASELLGLKLKVQHAQHDIQWLNDLTNIHQEIRRISHNLAPFKVEQFGLVEALKIFCIENSDQKMQVHYFSNGDKSVEATTAQIVYRCAQELIQNARKHAECKEIDVQLNLADVIHLTVEDNGIGMNNAQQNDLLNKISGQWLQSRILQDIHIESSKGNGTSIHITFSYA